MLSGCSIPAWTFPMQTLRVTIMAVDRNCPNELLIGLFFVYLIFFDVRCLNKYDSYENNLHI